ncbi:MAG: hypothetical protein K8W52_18270 [Deltaproteobacteria bacterium]|nr:hypothetical protein [Deltaproteobacteria bacterium]
MRVASTLCVVIGSWAFATIAAAQPAAKPVNVGKVPMLSVPCVPSGDIELLVSGDGPALCWAGGCMSPDLSSLAATMVPKPAPTPAWIGAQAELRTQGAGLAACKDTTCKPLGPKLTKAIAEARAGAVDGPVAIGVSGDLKAVAIGMGAWSVAKDKPIAFKAPKSYKGSIDKPFLGGVSVAGNLLVTQWSNCAGPCTVAQVTDSSGKNLGAELSGGGPIVQVDADHFAVVSEYGDIHVLSFKGKHIGDHETGGDPSGALAVARLAEGELALMHDDPGVGMRIERYYAGGTTPRLSSARTLPFCTP